MSSGLSGLRVRFLGQWEGVELNQRIALIASQPRVRHGSVQGVRQSGYWMHASFVAIVLLSLMGIRLYEVMPPVASIRPVLLAAVFGAGTVPTMSGASVHRSALNYPITKIILAHFFWLALAVPLGILPGNPYTAHVRTRSLENDFGRSL